MRWKHCSAYFFHVKTSNYGESAESSQLIQCSSDPRSTVDLESSFFSKKKHQKSSKKPPTKKVPSTDVSPSFFFGGGWGGTEKKQPTAVFHKKISSENLFKRQTLGEISAYGATSQSKGNEELLLEVSGITATLGICSLHHTSENLEGCCRR